MILNIFLNYYINQGYTLIGPGDIEDFHESDKSRNEAGKPFCSH
jgi:hypothetical protein